MENGFRLIWGISINTKEKEKTDPETESVVVLGEEVCQESKNSKTCYERNCCLVEDFLWSTTFKLSKVIASRNDWESGSFWLESNENNEKDSVDKKKDIHRKKVKSKSWKIRRII